jgi:ribose-phosphate pyrophosphokinase
MPSRRKSANALHRADVVFGFETDNWLAADLARELDVEYRTIKVHVFPDGDTKVSVPGKARYPVICRALHDPNAKLIELLLAGSVLKDQRAEPVTLVAPYLPYMRQDKAFHRGEAVSQKVVGRMLADAFDRFIAVDPHLHRVAVLDKVFSGKPALALTAAPDMAKHLAHRRPDRTTLVVGPDIESTPLAESFANAAGLSWVTARKNRGGDRDVRIALPAGVDFNRPVVIVDDIISSGTTIATLARLLKAAGSPRIEVYVTHALFDDKVVRTLKRAGVERTFSCDGIPHISNTISLAPLIAQGLNSWR